MAPGAGFLAGPWVGYYRCTGAFVEAGVFVGLGDDLFAFAERAVTSFYSRQGQHSCFYDDEGTTVRIILNSEGIYLYEQVHRASVFFNA